MASHFSGADPLLPRAAYASIIATVVTAALYYGKDILIPVVLAVLLSFVLNPLVNALRRVKVPRGPAVALVVAITVALVGALGFALARQVLQLGNDLPQYETTLRDKLKAFRTGAAQTGVIDKATSALKGLSQELEQQSGPMPPLRGAGAGQAQPQPIPVEVRQPPDQPLAIYQRLASALLSPVTTTAVVLIMVIFILIQRTDIRDRVIRLAGTRDILKTTAALDDAATRLSRLFLFQTALNASFGVVMAFGLWVIGVPSPMLWGVVAGLMRFVPYIGSIFSAVFPILLAASVNPGWGMVLETIGLFVMMESLVGNFIEPWLQGHSTGLSPLAIVMSAVLWTTLWGPIGLLIATPVTMCLVVLGRHIDGLTFLDVILGDEPALTPQETLYQRLLAGSSAEVAEQAETFLKSGSVLSYYDSVALAGLKLAAIDAERGVIDDDKMQELREIIAVLQDDLSEQPLEAPVNSKEESEDLSEVSDGASAVTAVTVVAQERLDPAYIGKQAAILCLGAKSPLDTAAAEILAQLLGRYGMQARTASILRLAEVGRLDLDGVRLIWISSTNTATAHAQIKYMMRRLRRLAPKAIICGAFWDVEPSSQVTSDIAGLTQTADTLAGAIAATADLVTIPIGNTETEARSEQHASAS